MLKGKYVASVVINFSLQDDDSEERPLDILPNSWVKEWFENDLTDTIKDVIVKEILDKRFMQISVKLESVDYYEDDDHDRSDDQAVHRARQRGFLASWFQQGRDRR